MSVIPHAPPNTFLLFGLFANKNLKRRHCILHPVLGNADGLRADLSGTLGPGRTRMVHCKAVANNLQIRHDTTIETTIPPYHHGCSSESKLSRFLEFSCFVGLYRENSAPSMAGTMPAWSCCLMTGGSIAAKIGVRENNSALGKSFHDVFRHFRLSNSSPQQTQIVSKGSQPVVARSLNLELNRPHMPVLAVSAENSSFCTCSYVKIMPKTVISPFQTWEFSCCQVVPDKKQC